MIISLIAAIGRNKVIGKNNTLPWNLPADLKRFKELTCGKPVIMGRKTFESIGRPLPDRINIILTRDKNFKASGAVVVRSAGEALKAAEGREEAMIIGGEQIYRLFLADAQRLYLTEIDADFDGDVYFPDFDRGKWQEIFRENHEADEKNPYYYTFMTLERK